MNEETNVQQPTDNAPNSSTNNQTQEPFKSFKTQEEYDNFCASIRKNAEERAKNSFKVKTEDGIIDMAAYNEQYKKQIAPTIAKEAVEKYKREQAMTENEKFEEAKREWEQQVRAEKTEINKQYADALMRKAGFSDKRRELELSHVTDDREASLGRITELCDLYKAEQDELEKKILGQIQQKNPSISMGNDSTNALQQEYNKAKSDGNITAMISAIRRAAEKNIKITE